MWLTLGVSLNTLQIERFEKPLQNTDIHFGAPTFVVFGYVYKHYIIMIIDLREFVDNLQGNNRE